MRRTIKTRLLFSLYLIFIPIILFGQNPEVKRERTFTGDGLYGFMDGGAEQYLEYGVSKLVTRDVVFKGEEYTIDIYDLPTPEDAFGIYSLHIFKCADKDMQGCIDCLSTYQMQTVEGNRYISVVFPSGTETARNNATELLRYYVKADPKHMPAFPAVLKLATPYSLKVKYLRGPIALSEASITLSKQLNGIKYSRIWFIPEKVTNSFKALIYVADKKDVAKLKATTKGSDIIEESRDYIYIKGIEAADDSQESDHGSFGF